MSTAPTSLAIFDTGIAGATAARALALAECLGRTVDRHHGTVHRWRYALQPSSGSTDAFVARGAAELAHG